MTSKYLLRLSKQVKSQFLLSANSDHGIDHWTRVEKVGLLLSKQAKADDEIIRLFALLHDSQRLCEGYDPEHGLRASEYAQRLFEQGLLVLEEPRLKLLKFACKYHNDRSVNSDDISVNICWDSDRIDLVRVGVDSKDIRLITQAGKDYLQKNG